MGPYTEKTSRKQNIEQLLIKWVSYIQWAEWGKDLVRKIICDHVIKKLFIMYTHGGC